MKVDTGILQKCVLGSLWQPRLPGWTVEGYQDVKAKEL